MECYDFDGRAAKRVKREAKREVKKNRQATITQMWGDFPRSKKSTSKKSVAALMTKPNLKKLHTNIEDDVDGETELSSFEKNDVGCNWITRNKFRRWLQSCVLKWL